MLFRFAAAAALIFAGAASSLSAQSVRVNGAGASFPFPLYATWTQAFSQQNSGVRIDYQSTGSGAGIRAFIDRTVDFAGSDAEMTQEQMDSVEGGLVVIPATAGKVVLAYNLPDVGELRLPRSVYPEIFRGAITRWNDERIVAANPGVTLPDMQITVVRRSDGAGTNFIFTNHLSAIDEAFASEIGVGTTVQWPNLANFVGAPRNDGVMATTMQTPGALGYVEYGFARMSNTPMAMLENASGEFILPSNDAGTLALSSGDFSGDELFVYVTDPSDPGAYPITSMTWMLFYRNHGDPQVAEALRNFVTWAMDDGQAMAAELNYVPLPDAVKESNRAKIAEIQ
ncbi:phosphate ABC transporter substrate-binding protein PstS [Rubrimonas cliftonensis]|uniref:Phosphate-binding protein PstS n=1 Tax=Rubrimonas cliftonensis TaxID=89524 RepID=A0A1H4FJR4_9RHOB|nr:phosphate ABC transporter substrate-binding protein PstS [Rubrimonas cliftonensis]SEA97536.1 phosphate ABC transporter substrate-binding protein, PhoT family [Rubrimonas cliftonensis]